MPSAPYPIPPSNEKRAPHGSGFAWAMIATLPFWAIFACAVH